MLGLNFTVRPSPSTSNTPDSRTPSTATKMPLKNVAGSAGWSKNRCSGNPPGVVENGGG